MRLLLIVFWTLLGVFTLLLGARMWGLGQQHSPYEHTFFTKSMQNIVIANSPESMELAYKTYGSNVIFWVDVYQWPSNEFLNQSKVDKKIVIANATPKNQINEQDLFLLSDAYKKWNQQRFVVNVIDNVMDIHLNVIKAVEPFNPDERTLIQSDADIIIQSIRSHKPQWVYGSSRSDFMRFLNFDSLWILPAVPFKGDVFVYPTTSVKKRNALQKDIFTEIQRRHKKIILLPTKEDSRDPKEWDSWPFDGKVHINF